MIKYCEYHEKRHGNIENRGQSHILAKEKIPLTLYVLE